ncbi:hypothetical protein [Priestia aryabhattai]|uniref:hypothetical protein n=1 Tax=Priestia aryabhattai TaxID=412384 RepID=UPI001C8EA558|nr:hypothetical protein [Priestia aryabhattai]MBX9988050.1 hypothetical protein [Priestia aryabhattai]
MTTYNICVSFVGDESDKTKIFYEGTGSYIGSTSKDKIKITDTEIIIDAKRSKRSEPEDIMKNTESTIFNQIKKGLVYYCALTGNKKKISKVEFTLNKGNPGESNKIFEKSKLKNPLDNEINKNLQFKSEALNIIFEEDAKARMLLNSLSYWLKAMSATDEGSRFEKLWRSFNAIYTYISIPLTRETNEKKKLIEVRKFIAKNSSFFPMSIGYFQSYNATTLRDIRWKELVYSQYQPGKIAEFKGLILRYKDSRMNEVFEMILPYRRKNLSSKDLKEIEDHIEKKKTAKKTCDLELLLFHVFNYMYFLRNKYFHAEKFDTTMNILANDEHKELAIMNDILSLFIVELINANKVY